MSRMDGVLAANFQRGRGAYCLHPKSSGLLLNGFYRAMSVHFDRQRGEWKIDLLEGATALIERLWRDHPHARSNGAKVWIANDDLAHLFRKRLAVASEGENGQRLAESKIR